MTSPISSSRTADGRSFHRRDQKAKGDPAKRWTLDEFKQKFVMCAGPVVGNADAARVLGRSVSAGAVCRTSRFWRFTEMTQINLSGVSETLVVEVAGQHRNADLNRPNVLNAINHEQRQNLQLAFTGARRRSSVRVIVLQGEARLLRRAGPERKCEHGCARREPPHRGLCIAVYDHAQACSKPIIARMQRLCTGAGLQLALLSDLRIADRSREVRHDRAQRGLGRNHGKRVPAAGRR